MTEAEEAEEWLGRLDIPIEAQTDIDTFQEYLRDELGIIGDLQIASLWGAVGYQTTLAEHGIRGVTIKYPWGTERRYGVQGMPGLWGWASILEIRRGEEW